MDEEKKKDETLVGTVMKNGGGAVAGVAIGGGVVGPIVGVALAPFTGGLSVALAPVILGAAAGWWGHKKSQELD